MNTLLIGQVLADIGRRTSGAGKIYLVGGGTALLLGFREATIDLDFKIDPEPNGIFEAIAAVKDSQQVNIELASPDQFIPELPGWRDRSKWIARYGAIDFYHYDFYSQALAKIERGFERDLLDVNNLIKSNNVVPSELLKFFLAIEGNFIRFPSIDPAAFRAKLDAVLTNESV